MKLVITSVTLFLAIVCSYGQKTIDSLPANTIEWEGKYVFMNALPVADYDTVLSIKVKTGGYYSGSHNGYTHHYVDNRRVIRAIVKKARRYYIKGEIDGYNGIILSDICKEATLINIKTSDKDKMKKANVRVWEGVPIYLNAHPVRAYKTLTPVIEKKGKVKFNPMGTSSYVETDAHSITYKKSISECLKQKVKEIKKQAFLDKDTGKPIEYDALLLDINYNRCQYIVFEKQN